MALSATIFKIELSIADLDRHYYGNHALTVARHPSETDLRMMARVIAFALNADDDLLFTRGLSSTDEPDLWQHSLSGEIERWIELGQADEKRLRQACGRSKRVIVYNYATKSADDWWQQNANKLSGLNNLTVIGIDESGLIKLAEQTERSLILHCTIENGDLSINVNGAMIDIATEKRC